MKKIELVTDWSTITMEQGRQGAKVKITIISQMPWEGRRNREVVWASPEDANEFYSKRVKQGFKRVNNENRF